MREPTEQLVKNLVGVLVTFNRPVEVADTVAKIAAQTRQLDHLYIVDNSTNMGDNENICRKAWGRAAGSLTWLSAGSNLGPAGGYELGMRRALDDYNDAGTWLVLFDDDDPPPSSTILEELESSVPESGAQALGVLGSVLNRRTGMLSRPSYNSERFPGVDQIGNGRLPFYDLAAIRDVGPMRGDLFYGREELELGLRLKKSGYQVCIDQEVRAKYEEQMGKTPRAMTVKNVDERDELDARTTLNHLRILRTHVGFTSFLCASVLFLGADLLRVVFGARSGSMMQGVRNLRGTAEAVAGGITHGRLLRL